VSNFTVDLHAHAIVPDALVELQRAHPDYCPVLIHTGGRQYLKYPAHRRLGPLPDGIFDQAITIDHGDYDADRVRFAAGHGGVTSRCRRHPRPPTLEPDQRCSRDDR
jgi:hypothetical protein